MSIASMIGQLVEIFRGWTPPTPTPTPTPDPYILPPATSETLGGIKVGEGLEVAEDGTLSAQASGGEDSFIFEAQAGEDEDTYTLVSAPCTVAEFTERAQTGGLPYRVVLRWKDLGEKFHCTELIANEITTNDDGPIQFSCIQWSNMQTLPVVLDINEGEFRLTNHQLDQ